MDQQINRSGRGGARPGAGRKPLSPVVRGLRDAIAALDQAATALAEIGEVTGAASYQLVAELLAAQSACLRQRALAARPRAGGEG